MSEGARAQAAYGFEPVAGQKSTTLYGIKVKNLQFTPKPTFERTMNIDPRGQRQKGRVLRFQLPVSFETEPSVNDLARLRFHQQGYAAITTVATGVYDWSIRDLLSSDSLTTDPASLTFEGYRDDSYAQLMLAMAISDFNLSVKANKIASVKVAGMACAFTHMADPVVGTTAATYTGKLHVRGNRQGADASNTTDDLKVKCTTGGALNGTAEVKFTKGATAYGSVAYPVTAGVWMDVILADGTHASGDPLDPVQVMFSAGGTLSTNDDFTIDAKRTPASVTYPSLNPLTAVGAKVTIDGTVYPIDSFDLSFKRPRKEKYSCGSKFPSSILFDGTREITVKINRDYTDRDLYLLMLSSEAVSFDITINGDLIATVANVSYFEKYQLTSTNAQVIAAGADIPGDKQLPESIEIVPYYDGSSVDMSETIRCTLATLA